MTCDAYVCGTGGFTGPKPGDPGSVSGLSAVPAFGGIDVSWTFPSTNPAAVAHTLLFRAESAVFANAIQRAVVAGNTFYDKVNTGQTYYYWIQVVSVNGTVGDLIGPAWATARPLIQDLITELTGRIDAGLLANVLKSDLSHLSVLDANLAAEIFDRETSNTSFAQALIDVQNGVAGAHTYITNEALSRTTANTAIAESINLLAVTLGSNIAAVQTNQTAWVTTSGARMDGFDGQFTTANGKISDIGALYTTKLTVNGLVGGFGVYNDGTFVEAGFDVDTFWIGRTAANKRKPFIIVGSETFIDEAVINHLTFSKLRDEAGTFIVADGKVKADYIDTKGMVIRDSAGNPVFSAGSGLDASRVNGLGSLATQDAVVVGSNIRLPDGYTMGVNDFVNRLGKLGSGNISTFMDAAAIGNAYIGNAAVNTLKIEGETVMVPRYAEGLYYYSLSDSWTSGLSPLTFSINGLNSGESCRIMVVAVIQAYPTDITQITLDTGIFVDGVLNSDVGTTLESKGLTVSCIGSFLKQNGTYVVDIRLRCAPESGGAASKGTCTVIPKFIVMAAKR